MALLLDTRTLPAGERIVAASSVLCGTEASSAVFHYDQSGGAASHRFDYWDLGPGVHVNQIVGSGLGYTRGPKQLRAAPERVGLGFRLRTAKAFTHCGTYQIVPPGHLSLADGTSTIEATWPGVGGTKLLLIDYDRLGLPVDLVRRAVPRLQASPVYPLVRAHMALLCDDNAGAEPGPEKAMLRVATIELARALITTAAGDQRGPRDLHSTLYLRVSKYLERHLTDLDLNAESVAAAHNVSVRTLYNAWSAVSEVPLSQWIIAARLEGARAQLSRDTPAVTIASVARRWGFSDATHFARRFRSAYGLSPREWRELHLPPADGLAATGVIGRLL